MCGDEPSETERERERNTPNNQCIRVKISMAKCMIRYLQYHEQSTLNN